MGSGFDPQAAHCSRRSGSCQSLLVRFSKIVPVGNPTETSRRGRSWEAHDGPSTPRFGQAREYPSYPRGRAMGCSLSVPPTQRGDRPRRALGVLQDRRDQQPPGRAAQPGRRAHHDPVGRFALRRRRRDLPRENRRSARGVNLRSLPVLDGHGGAAGAGPAADPRVRRRPA